MTAVTGVFLQESEKSVSLEEQVDIDEARKREILEYENKLTTSNHYEILGLPDGANVEQVTAAFRTACKQFHPDRYFGKYIGSYRARLEQILKRLIEAHAVLSDTQRRDRWLRANPHIQPPNATGAPFSNGGTSPQRSALQQARDSERRARFARHPYLAKATHTQEHLRKAKDAMAKGEYSYAVTLLNQVRRLLPSHAEANALLDEAHQKIKRISAQKSFREGLKALEILEEKMALDAFKAAVEMDPSHHEAAYQAAMLLHRSGAHAQDVVSYLQRAVDISPGKVAYRLMLGQQFEMAGMRALASKHFKEAARLAPDDPEVTKHLQKNADTL